MTGDARAGSDLGTGEAVPIAVVIEGPEDRHRGVVVVAVGIICHETWPLRAGRVGGLRISEAVSIAIGVPPQLLAGWLDTRLAA